MQNLDQGETYYSSSHDEQLLIRDMPAPHALRALAKLEREYGWDVTSTPLWKALRARADQGVDAEQTEIPAGKTGRKMLRDQKTKRFKGTWRPSPSRKKTI